MKITQQQEQALNRAVNNTSMRNYPEIYEGFTAKGIPEKDIRPRQNVFTYRAWQKLGRQVRKGEHGVRITTWIAMTKKDKVTGDRKEIGMKPKRATVFHVTQTEPLLEHTQTHDELSPFEENETKAPWDGTSKPANMLF